ncbi:hypothetical protein MAP00_001222 [Monascus purpureus]|nr:hypothetical protein MAP00_001222 [Monascus purpureus]
MDIALDHQGGRLDAAGNCYDLTWADGGGAALRAVIIGPLHGPRYSIDCSEEDDAFPRTGFAVLRRHGSLPPQTKPDPWLVEGSAKSPPRSHSYSNFKDQELSAGAPRFFLFLEWSLTLCHTCKGTR